VRDKVFSAAPIYDNQNLQGYLYIVLGGQAYDSVVELLQSSYILRFWIGAVLVSLLVALLAGFMMFRHITSRIHQLANSMEQFKQNDFQHPADLMDRFDRQGGDEIDQLGSTFRGMSERINSQFELIQQNDASRREMVANVSHDLRTPLASLQGYLETLKLKVDQLSDKQRQEYIDIAYKNSKHLQKLITELFELATLESRETLVHYEVFSMNELIQDVCHKFNLKAENKGLKLFTAISTQPAFVYADIGLIQRVLENLIENAIKYTPEGGQVSVALLIEDQQITAQISDTGQGIAAEDIPRIFDRFYRVEKHRDLDGTGFGLAIAKRIMQLHDSFIEVQSKPDLGTTFSFSLPHNVP
jgi:signal transduction histidine kinase